MALTGAFGHTKTRHLARLLRALPVSYECLAEGLLEAFWHWVRVEAPTGRVEIGQMKDVAHAIFWAGEPDDLYSVLVKSGYLDDMVEWFWVHGWDEHADDNLRRKLEYKGLTFANGSPTRRWQNKQSKAVDSSRTKVLEKSAKSSRKVSQKFSNSSPEVPHSAGAGPVPASLPPSTPPARDNAETGEIEAYREILHAAMPPDAPPPGDQLIAEIRYALDEMPATKFRNRMRQFRKAHPTLPQSYGYWRVLVRDWYLTKLPENPPTGCRHCGGTGRTTGPGWDERLHQLAERRETTIEEFDCEFAAYHPPCAYCTAPAKQPEDWQDANEDFPNLYVTPEAGAIVQGGPASPPEPKEEPAL